MSIDFIDQLAGEDSELNFRMEAHYRRLIGSGYGDRAAEAFVRDMYASSYRDVLQAREEEPAVTETAPESPVEDTTPVTEQKFVAKRGVGLVKFVGSRFVSVEWLNGGRERIALKNFRTAVESEDFKLIPKIRVAKRV